MHICKSLSEPILEYCYLTLMKFQLIYIHFLSRKCIWKCPGLNVLKTTIDAPYLAFMCDILCCEYFWKLAMFYNGTIDICGSVDIFSSVVWSINLLNCQMWHRRNVKGTSGEIWVELLMEVMHGVFHIKVWSILLWTKTFIIQKQSIAVS